MSEQVSVNIDGRSVSVPAGTPLIEAAARIGINIPRLCYCPGLKSTGACRVCLVELEGNKSLVVSCARRAKDGMVVRTNTPRVIEARRFVVDLILSNHPGDCLSCDKNGACGLQDAAYLLSLEQTSYPMKDPGYLVDASNPFIERNYRLCVLCGRCIRICAAQSANILEFMERGMTTKVGTAGDRPLQESGCDFCGSCVSVCPVAALMEKDRRFRGREWQLKTTMTSCAYCGCGCSTVMSSLNGHVLRATPVAMDDFICARGRFGWDYLESSERLKHPLIRRNGELAKCSWEEALDYAAQRLQQIKDSFGANSIGGLMKGTATNESIYAFQRLLRDCLGTNNVDGSARQYSYLTQATLLNTFEGSQVIASSDDLELAQLIVVVGADVTNDYPLVGAKVKRALLRGAKLVVIDPVRTAIAERGEVHLQPKAGTEGLLLAGLAKAMLKLGTYNHSFVSHQTQKFDELNRLLTKLDEAEIADKTGVTAEEVAKVATLFGDVQKKAVVVFPAEINDSQFLQGIINLLLLTGRTRRSVVPCLLFSNLQGGFDFGGLADLLPARRKVADDQARVELEKRWNTTLPAEPGLTAMELVEAAGDKIRALVIFGGNPLGYFPGGPALKSQLEALDFLLVQDVFLSETAKLADVVLPAATFAESGGSRVNFEHRLVKQRPTVEPGGKTDFEIIKELAARLGCPLIYRSRSELARETREVWFSCQSNGSGQPMVYSFDVNQYEAAYERTSKEYPLLLMVGGTSFHFHDAHLTRHSKLALLEEPAEGYIGLSIEDAKAMSLSDGSNVVVRSKAGSIKSKTMVLASLPRGLIFAPRWYSGVYELLNREITLESKTPRFRLVAVAVSAQSEAEGGS